MDALQITPRNILIQTLKSLKEQLDYSVYNYPVKGVNSTLPELKLAYTNVLKILHRLIEKESLDEPL